MAGGEFMLSHEDNNVEFMVVGKAAEGSIEAKDDQFERLEEFTERLASGEFHREAHIADLAACVDGRRAKSDTGALIPNSAGGTLTYFVADHLTSRGISGDGTTLEAFMRVLGHLKARDVVLGDHTDSHVNEDKTGCGANDRLKDIYAYIANKGDILREWAGKLGVDIPEETHDLITSRAQSTTEFSPSTDMKKALRQHTSELLVPELQGDHKEVATVVNMRKGTTLDRAALAEEFGPNMQAFNVDAWQFENAARQLSDDDTEVSQMVAAMVYYNLATAFVLSGSGMRVVVLKDDETSA